MLDNSFLTDRMTPPSSSSSSVVSSASDDSYSSFFLALFLVDFSTAFIDSDTIFTITSACCMGVMCVSPPCCPHPCLAGVVGLVGLLSPLSCSCCSCCSSTAHIGHVPWNHTLLSCISHERSVGCLCCFAASCAAHTGHWDPFSKPTGSACNSHQHSCGSCLSGRSPLDLAPCFSGEISVRARRRPSLASPASTALRWRSRLYFISTSKHLLLVLNTTRS